MERTGFIGGSDMMTIMDGDWEYLWQIKTGRAVPDDLSNVFPVQLGIATEEFNMSLVEDATLPMDRQHVVANWWEGVPLKATLDGYRRDLNGNGVGVECKHTYERNTLDNQLQKYMPQLQFYMWVADCSICISPTSLATAIGKCARSSVTLHTSKQCKHRSKSSGISSTPISSHSFRTILSCNPASSTSRLMT